MHQTMRHILAGSGMIVALAVLGALLIVYGGTGWAGSKPGTETVTPAGSAVAIPFTEVTHGLKSEVTERTNYLITSPTELKTLWKLLDATTTPPKVDFNRNAVLAIFAGQQPSPGYAIAVSKIEDASARMVSITVMKPQGSCAQVHSVTAPYEIVVVPATALPLTHEDIPTVKGCP